MARRGRVIKPLYLGGDPSDACGMAAHLLAHLEWGGVKGFSASTLQGLRYRIGYFIAWCEERGITRPAEVSRPVIARYQRYLHHRRTKEGWPLSFRTQHGRLLAVLGFFKWLARNNVILYNPAADLELPRREKRLPRHILTASEAERVLSGVDIHTPVGVRDRAILETFYSTGMRRMELARLNLSDLDTSLGTVMIRQGKWKKDRLIPIGERALAWLKKYLVEVRPALAVEPDGGTLFLAVLGEPLSGNRLTNMVHEYVWKARLGKQGSCHLFRHTMATLMLENGADIRYIQQMLGHEQLTSTQIYTQVSIRKLKEIHTATHPARMTRATGRRGAPEDEDDAAVAVSLDDTPPATMVTSDSPATSSSPDARAMLMRVLAAESEEEDE